MTATPENGTDAGTEPQTILLLWPLADGRKLLQINKPPRITIPENRYYFARFQFDNMSYAADGFLTYPGKKKSSYSGSEIDCIYAIVSIEEKVENVTKLLDITIASELEDDEARDCFDKFRRNIMIG
jgi:hypothetical protein